MEPLYDYSDMNMKCKRCGTQDSERFVVREKFNTPWTCPQCGGLVFKFRPMKDLVCIHPIPLPGTFIPGGQIVRVEADVELEWKGRSPYGIVLNYGEGYTSEDGEFHRSVDLTVGDLVIYDSSVPNRLHFKGLLDHKEHLVVVCGYKDVGAVVTDFDWSWKGVA